MLVKKWAQPANAGTTNRGGVESALALFWSTIRIILGCAYCACLLAACRPGTAGLSRPTGVAAAADGSLYVMDHTDLRHSRVVHISAQGKVLDTFQPEAPKPGLVYAGWDMAVGPTGIVYYCNLVSNDDRTVHDGLMAFSPDGEFLFEIGAADYAVDSSELSAVPYNLDVDNRGWIYVVDFNYNQLRVFDSQGQLLAKLNADNVEGFHYSGIGDVAVDDRRNLLYLTDFYEGRLDQYRLSIQTDGTIQLRLQFSVGAFGHGPGEFSFPQYLAVDEVTGMVYVGDMGNRRILALDPRGNFVAEFSPPVDEWQVLGLAIGADTEHPGDQVIYAADALNQVIWAFAPDGQFLRKIEVH
jgi:DNA-binding beta-propeller fold protein YncE